MNEFVAECRQEWRRLGVPDPIANEMAADLTADIDEAEAEGGSAEDVLGSSVFDPRQFAAAWADARGVTPPPTPVVPTTLPEAPAPQPDAPRRWPVLAAALTILTLLFTMAAAALVVGRHGVAMAAQVRRVVTGPGPSHLFGPGGVTPPFRTFNGPGVAIQNMGGFGVLAVMLLVFGVIATGLVVLYWAWYRRRPHTRLRWPGN